MKRLLCLAITAVLGFTGQAQGGKFLVGVGRADITPHEAIRLSGYANRDKPSEGVDQQLFVKALSIQEEGRPPFLLITADIIGFPREVAEMIADRIHHQCHIPRENILLVASHTHTGPIVGGNLTVMFDLKPQEVEVIDRFTRHLEDQSIAVAMEAVKNATPANIGFGRGKATFAINRRVVRRQGVDFGTSPNAPVSHEVPVFRIDNPDGSVRAVVFGYACHCTTLNGDWFRIGGDWAGFAQEYLERSHPGATAFFVTGCGADSNPNPRGKLEHAREHGMEMAGAVSQALKGPLQPVGGPLKAVFDRVDLPFAKLPTSAQYQQRLESKDPNVRRHARRQLDLLDQEDLPESYPCPVQVWRFGKDLTLVALGGEVVVDYVLRMHREYPTENLWMVGYANDVFAYVPSARILREGGYEADSNLIYYGLPTRFRDDVEEILMKKIGELMAKTK